MEPSGETRELTVDEAVAVAMLLLQNEQLDEAQALYQRILEAAPDHPDALHFAGVLAHQQGRSEEAIGLIEKSLAIAPGRADCYSNLGIIYKSMGRLEEAVGACERAIVIDSGHANAHSNLGVLQRARGRAAEAEAAYRAAIRLDPQHIDAYTNLGVLLNGLKRTEEAAACYSRVITLRPKHKDARRLLALAHCALGEVDQAVAIFDEWLHEEPDDPIARHMHAACTGRAVPARASNEFVERTFDGFAESFDSRLERLSYRAPALVAAMIEDAGVERAKRLDVLDAGCGTGLCGPLLSPYARRLVGVDLSERMLTRAREKLTYDTLEQRELTQYLGGNRGRFDLIASADTLVYFGDLDPVVSAAAGALRSSGLLVFTLEHAVGAGEGVDYCLEFHGRYAHRRTYVERVLAAAGLRPHIAEADLRMESGVPVAGLVVRALKS